MGGGIITADKKRQVFLVFISVLLILFGLGSLLQVKELLVMPELAARGGIDLRIPSVAMVVILSGLEVLGGIFLLKRKEWARKVVIGFSMLYAASVTLVVGLACLAAIIAGAARFPVPTGPAMMLGVLCLVVAAWNVLVIFYLTRPKVRSLFQSTGVQASN